MFAWIGLLRGQNDIFTNIIKSTFDLSKLAFEISIGLTGALCLWMGIMRIGENAGFIQMLTKLFRPLFRKIFPEVPDDHPALGSITVNMAANMLGLDNAATPSGLKAMKELQSLNATPDTASNAQILFLVINTSAVTIIPVTIFAYRAQQGAANPTDVFIPILISTFASTFFGFLSVAWIQKIKILDKVILSYLGSLLAIVMGALLYFQSLSPQEIETQSGMISSVLLVSVIVSFIVAAMRKKVNVYESFVEGAKGGFELAITIIPYLVAMLVAIGVFRASGAMDFLLDAVRAFFSFLHINADFVDALPTALMKPLSGSGARGLMFEAMETFGADSFVGRLASVVQGSTETTFYVLAVYFGSVGIKKTRYAAPCGLIADAAGIITAIFVSYLFFY
ncbi:MAG: spore maturation protein [Bdellovibrionales bacterium]|nr:spore maturation protein [Bdellovibrionales bacterium]